MNSIVRRTLLKLTIEYFLLVLPILIYVSLESLHHRDAWYLFRSPEWSIATIFIVIQTIRIHLESIGDNWNRSFTILMIILLGVIALAAGINIYIGLGDVNTPSTGTMITKWVLYLISSLLFVYVAGAGVFLKED